MVLGASIRKKQGKRVSEFVAELFQTGLYKRSQGRIARQVTFVAMAVIFALGAWRLKAIMFNASASLQYGLPLVVMSIGWWISYRLVNTPKVADFLISVEAEMNKVSWPSRAELARSVIVVIFTVLFLAAVLFMFDLIWSKLLSALGVA